MSDQSPPSWHHYNPVRITAGAGVLDDLPSLVNAPGEWLLLASPGCTRRGTTARIQTLLETGGARRVRVHDQITPNPELDVLESFAGGLGAASLAGIVGVGGGSVIDAAKVVAVIVDDVRGRPLDRALREGQARQWQRSIPLVAIPTTSGTGAEATPFATVWDAVSQKKHSVAGEQLFPDHCLLDPTLTLSLPHDETLYTGLDATSHALESLWNRNRTAVSESLALGALERITTALPRVLTDPRDLAHRQDMQHASLMAGMAISQTRTAIAHSISYPLTLRFGIPHGLACSFTLQAILQRHMQALASTSYARLVLSAVLELLAQLDLRGHLERYASADQVMELLPSMTTPGRSDNFAYPHDLALTLRDALGRS